MSRCSSVRLGLLLLIALAGTMPAAAQTPPAPAVGDTLGATVDLPAPPVAVTPTPEPARAPEPEPVVAPAASERVPAAPIFSASADTLTVLVDYRPESDILNDLQNAVTAKAQAERGVEHARMLAKLAESRIGIKSSEIDALEAEIDFAKAEKNDAKRSELESRRKFAETEKQLLEKRRDLREREIETARALHAYQETTEKTCRQELDLARKRRERGLITSTVDPDAAAEFSRLQAEVTKLEGRVLETQVEQADKRKDLADQEVKLGKIRRAVYESQLKVARSGR
jgi:hypothetical protein